LVLCSRPFLKKNGRRAIHYIFFSLGAKKKPPHKKKDAVPIAAAAHACLKKYFLVQLKGNGDAIISSSNTLLALENTNRFLPFNLLYKQL
jgi:hypothetical protein